MAKQILPWFGGGSVVWASCLLFFQVALVGGYAYAHLSRRLGVTRQIRLHLLLLALALSDAADRAVGRTGNRRRTAPVARVARCPVADRRVSVRAARGHRADAAGLVRAPRSRIDRRTGCTCSRTSGRCSRSASIRSCSSDTSSCARRPCCGPPGSSCSVSVALWCAAAMRDVPDARDARQLRRPAPPVCVDRTLWFLLPAIGSGLLVATTSSADAGRRGRAAPLGRAARAVSRHVHRRVRRAGTGAGSGARRSSSCSRRRFTCTSSESDSPILLQGVALVGGVHRGRDGLSRRARAAPTRAARD